MAEPFATADDLIPVPTGDEYDRAEQLFAEAAVWLRAWFSDVDDRIVSGDLAADVPAMVSRNMVKRALRSGDFEGVKQSQVTQSLGSISATESRQYSNPDGNLYVTAQEADLMRGVAARTASAVSMTCEGM